MAAGTEVDSAGMHSIIKVSPTVLSSDLFTPCQLTPRVTLPSMGEFQHPICSACGTWGCDITHYGGIGPYTFQGKQRIRDLPVSRSHRHYGSGLGKSSTNPQPYRLTSLKLSGSRKNDEILPPPMRVTYPRSSTWQNEPWPGHHAYTSHRPKFEVFPRIDPQQTEYGGPVLPQSRTKQVLGRATNIALGELTQKRYQSTHYRESFNQLLDQGKTHDITPVDCSQNTEVLGAKDVEEKSGEDDGEDEEEGDTDSGIGSERESVTSLHDGLDTSLNERVHSANCPLYGRDTKENEERTVSFSDNVNEDINTTGTSAQKTQIVAGIGPCWPPSTSYAIENINGSQLLERDDIQKFPPAYRSTLKPECTCQKKRKKSATSRSTSHSYGLKSAGSVFNVVSGLSNQHRGQLNPITHRVMNYSSRPKSPLVKKDSKIVTNEILLKNLGVASNPSKEDITVDKRPFVIPNSYNSRTGKENLPALKESAIDRAKILTKPSWSSLPLPPAPLSDCISPSGSRVPHRLGLRYKTEAHYRFKALHPESVPDLRDARNSGRKVIFFNYHSSAFRG